MRSGWILRMGVVVVMQLKSASTRICWPVAVFEKLKAATWF